MLGRHIIKILVSVRNVSTLKNIDLIYKEGIAVMNLQRRPVNALNRGLLGEMQKYIEDLSKDEECKGLVITSAIPKIFSAGIDLTELHNPEPENLRMFWRQLRDTFLTIYGADIPTTVAIDGHTAAGALLIAVMSDYRVMVNNEQAKIGFNDTAVGIKPGWFGCEVINRVMGHRQAEIAITTSRMYTPEEALKVQMIDELATDKEDAIEKCKEFIRSFDKIPRKIASATKRQLREDIIRYVEEDKENDIELSMRNILNPYAQRQISNFVEQLHRRKK